MGENEIRFEARVNRAVQEMIALGYRPMILVNMIAQHGTVNAVRMLITRQHATEGFTRLWELRRLDLSMENIIQEPEWNDLFNDDERARARRRLAEYGYTPDAGR